MSIIPKYTVARARSLPAKISAVMRRRMFDRFMEATGIESHHTVLDVGATSDQDYEQSNYFEAWYPHKEKITAVGVEDASFLERKYPGLQFRRADGRDLPFPDRHFDFVHASAVIEHVGSASDQKRFLGEVARVSRNGVFVTTPNRWFPVEFHTLVPLVHWLPKLQFQAILRFLGRDFFADEANLNLLGQRDLKALCAGITDQVTIELVPLLGFTSNLILILRR